MDRRVLAGILFSLLAHAAILGFAPAPDVRSASALTALNDPDEDRLGVATSDAVTVTWLGFEDPSEHQARQARVEQAELVMGGSPAPPPDEPESRSPTSPQSQPAAESEPTEPAPTDPVPPQPTPEPSTTPTLTLEKPSERASPKPTPIAVEQPDLPRSTPLDAPPATSPATEPQPAAKPPSPSSAPQPTTEASAATQAAQPGKDDAEAAGTSRERPVRINPGRPAAVEGRLKIDPRVPPEFRAPARVLGAPRAAVFRIEFRKNGTVRLVTLEQSSGSPRVDEPWRTAIYNWKGEGPALDDLPQDDPDASYTVYITLLPP